MTQALICMRTNMGLISSPSQCHIARQAATKLSLRMALIWRAMNRRPEPIHDTFFRVNCHDNHKRVAATWQLSDSVK